MKILSPKIHGFIDYASVVGLLLAPTLLGLQSVGAMLAYALAAIHLTMTILTAFPLGLMKIIPLSIHGMVELAVGIALVVVSFATGNLLPWGPHGQLFVASFGLVLLLVWLVTDYGGRTANP